MTDLRDAGADESVYPVWLLVTNEDPPEAQVRASWNVKDSSVDAIAERSPSLWIGDSCSPGDGEPTGAADRVNALLFLRGTIPDYRLPVLDDDLVAELLAACSSRQGDAMPAAGVDEVARFLAKYSGWKCFT